MTIDIKDFRIGNIFQPLFTNNDGTKFIPTDVFYKAIKIKSSTIVAVNASIENSATPKEFCIDSIAPISLSENVILNCGFKESLFVMLYILSISETEYFAIQRDPISGKYHEIRYGKEIESLNKLQNIFYDLTNLELEVNLANL